MNKFIEKHFIKIILGFAVTMFVPMLYFADWEKYERERRATRHSSSRLYVLVDTETGVHYVSGGGALTPRLDAQGAIVTNKVSASHE